MIERLAMIRLMLDVPFQEFLSEKQTRFESRMSFDPAQFLDHLHVNTSQSDDMA